MDMHNFRTQLLATTAVLALSGAAYAADMPVKAPPPAPVVAPVVNWTGFYVGAQIGGASFDPSCSENIHDFNGQPCANAFGTDKVDSPGTTSSSLSTASVIGGGKIGYDWQGLFGWDRVVVGVVGEFDWTGLRGNQQTTGFFDGVPDGLGTATERIDWLASARGRVGWAFDNVLFYATGGVAWTRIKESASFTCPFPTCATGGEPFGFSSSASTSKTGAVAGGGFEYRVTPHVSVVGEFLWYGFGSSSLNSQLCDVSGCAPGTYTTAFKDQDIVSGTLGVNWRF
jgi:outer membrane immunogenic protein